MLQTINISLPQTLASKIEKTIKAEGYASRSEFFRTLIRLYFLLGQEKSTLLPYQKISLSKVKKNLEGENYNPQFVDSVLDGLKKSSLYQTK
jgi:metal-responsive CopG/Arc/MetJ family transcriptional regulator